MRRLLITGAAGFIGGRLAKKLLEKDEEIEIVGIDNINDYYSPALKEERLRLLKGFDRFRFVRGGIEDKQIVSELFRQNRFDIVINFAAQAGVRYSIDNPDAYIESNVVGFFNILEACRHSRDERIGNRQAEYGGVRQLIYASSSSVYGGNSKLPYSEGDKADRPVSLYAATKKADELLAYAYSRLYNISCTGLRFFTVYGPMGRPDMAYFKFADRMRDGRPIQLYNYGDMYRDFTFVDDIVESVIKIVGRPPEADECGTPHKVYNIGGSRTVSLLQFVELLEKALLEEGVINKPARKEFLPMQPGDVYRTHADVQEFTHDFGYCPHTPLEEGLQKFASWYGEYAERRSRSADSSCGNRICGIGAGRAVSPEA